MKFHTPECTANFNGCKNDNFQLNFFLIIVIFLQNIDCACVQGSTNGTNGIPISFKVIQMVPLVIPLVPMVMQMVSLALPMVPLVSPWYHWLPMAPLVKLPMVPLGEPQTEPVSTGEKLRRF